MFFTRKFGRYDRALVGQFIGKSHLRQFLADFKEFEGQFLLRSIAENLYRLWLFHPISGDFFEVAGCSGGLRVFLTF